jgi:hypothetical protein
MTRETTDWILGIFATTIILAAIPLGLILRSLQHRLETLEYLSEEMLAMLQKNSIEVPREWAEEIASRVMPRTR